VFHSNIAFVHFMPGAHDRSKQWVQIQLGIFLKELNCGFYLQPCCDFYCSEIKNPLSSSTCAHQYSVFSHTRILTEKKKGKKNPDRCISP